jgi:hypothetical protein
MHGVAEIIRALAALLWPLIVLLLLIVYRPEVQRFFRRIRRARGKVMGQELELELDALDSSATEAQEEASTVEVRAVEPPAPTETGDPAKPGAASEHFPSPRLEAADDPVERVLQDAASSPRLALVTLSGELERTLRRILASSQSAENWERKSLQQMIRRIDLGPGIGRGVRQFSDVRNRVVHGRDVDDEDVVRTLDSGLKLLSALISVDYERHIVEYSLVPVFSDSDAMQTREITAVILRTSTATTARRDVFPCRRQYRSGEEVTWEWLSSTAWPRSWYRDPSTGEIESAWDAAAEFVGRPVSALD